MVQSDTLTKLCSHLVSFVILVELHAGRICFVLILFCMQIVVWVK